jgi:predicted metalloprotease with PDZ domain
VRQVSLMLLIFALCSIAPAESAGRRASNARPLAALPDCEVKLTPRPAKTGDGSIGSVDIELVFGAIRVAPGEPLLQLALIADNVDTVATTLSNLRASDLQGPLKLSARDMDLPTEAARDSETGGQTREWIVDRAPVGRVTVRYTVPAIATLPPRGAAPPLAFRNDAAGVSASGNVFLLMPPGTQHYAVTTRWDLSRLKSNAIGATSLGEGTAKGIEPMSSAELRESYFMGGEIHRWPSGESSPGFFSAWQGTPPFDAVSFMSWTRSLYQQYSQFFGRETDEPYGVFLRYNPVNAGGGTGLFHSFIMTYGAGSGADVTSLKSMVAHETFHTFQPFISVPAGKESSWFAEGLAVLYEARLPLRYGLMTPEAFLQDLNSHAARYYSSIMATRPNSEIAAYFWDDTRIRTLAYDRGMLYFAVVDDAVRTKSGGKRSLDQLMLHMLALESQGRMLSNKDWETELQTELGDGAVAQFHGFLNGTMPIPASDAFGPCFIRTLAHARRYELGFSTVVLREPQRVVRGLVPGSAADQAGLQNGDEVINPVPQDEIQGNQTELLKLDILRKGREFAISYLPRGEEVEVYQWTRAVGVPDSHCGL